MNLSPPFFFLLKPFLLPHFTQDILWEAFQAIKVPMN